MKINALHTFKPMTYDFRLLTHTISIFFLFQAVTNTGCCGANQCNIPDQINSSHQEEKIIFEEIKNK